MHTLNEHACKTRFHFKGSSQMNHSSLVRNSCKWPKTKHSSIPVNSCRFSGVFCYLLTRSCRNLVVVPNPLRILPVTEFEKMRQQLQPFKRSFLYFGCSSAWLVVQRRKYHVTGLCKGPNTNN